LVHVPSGLLATLGPGASRGVEALAVSDARLASVEAGSGRVALTSTRPVSPTTRWLVLVRGAEAEKLGTIAVGFWVTGTFLVISCQAVRITRFRRRLEPRIPPPPWLVAILRELASEFGVRPPPLRLVSEITSPLLWCLGRPVLLVPAALLDRLEVSQ